MHTHTHTPVYTGPHWLCLAQRNGHHGIWDF